MSGFLGLAEKPAPLPFPGIIVCATCEDRPCWCCNECGAVLGICEHGDLQAPRIPSPSSSAVMAAVQVLADHGIDGATFERLQAAQGRTR